MNTLNILLITLKIVVMIMCFYILVKTVRKNDALMRKIEFMKNPRQVQQPTPEATWEYKSSKK
ncbi:MAG TPA: hypothetical protein VIM37_04150 [Candidatus Microsaccharimonas sp.]|jgi:hypothetical protein